MLYTIVGILVMILDQGVKYWVDHNINMYRPSIDLIKGVITLVRVQNDGAAFSFLSGGGARIWFIILTGVFTLLVIIALATNFIRGKFGRWCMVLVTAGGLSNCIDRVLYGYVLDMFKLEFIDFAVFNVADIFISVFCIAFIIYILFGGEKSYVGETDEFDEEDDELEDRPDYKALMKKSKVREKKAPKSVKAQIEEEVEETVYVKQPKAAKRPKVERAGSNQSEPVPEKKAPARPAVKPAPAAESDDPFAEWERFNSKAKAAAADQAAAAAKQAPAARPVVQEQPAARPAAEPKPAARPQPKPSSSIDELDLDAILNEFK